jgi:DNA-binding protein YbaB
MSERIDQFYETLRLKLADVDKKLSALKAKTDAQGQNAEREMRTYLDALQKRIEQGQAKASAAQAEVAKWMEQRKAAGGAVIAEWKSKGELTKLRARADFAERYALAAIDVAVAAMDAAEEAALEAWLARHDAGHAHSK